MLERTQPETAFHSLRGAATLAILSADLDEKTALTQTAAIRWQECRLSLRSPLDPPLLDLYYKDDALGDPLLTEARLERLGLVDAALCGGTQDWMDQWHHVLDIIGKRDDVGRVYALSGLITRNGGPIRPMRAAAGSTAKKTGSN